MSLNQSQTLKATKQKAVCKGVNDFQQADNHIVAAPEFATPQSTSQQTPSPSGPQSNNSNDSIQWHVVGARICQVIVPVLLCTIYTCVLVRILSWNVNHGPGLLDKTWDRMGMHISTDSVELTITSNLIIVCSFILIIVLITLFIMLVFYLEWHCCLAYYFYLPSFITMLILTPLVTKEVLQALNWFPIDLITTILCVWNFTAVGMVAIFNIYVAAPLILQQYFLVHNSAILAALIILTLPGWAPWMLLSFLVLWDLFAVLAPFGPLNLIITMAEREGMIDMPGLIYSTDVPWDQKQETENNLIKEKQQAETQKLENDNRTIRIQSDLSKVETIESDSSPNNNRLSQQTGEADEKATKRPNIEEKGVNIGLGDFIFYSLLVGITSKGRDVSDFYTTLATLDAILVGLIFTLVLLAYTRRALPALPVSIGLGILIAGLTMYLVPQLSNRFAAEAIFV